MARSSNWNTMKIKNWHLTSSKRNALEVSEYFHFQNIFFLSKKNCPFSAFMFLSGNCDKPEQKQTGCQQVKFIENIYINKKNSAETCCRWTTGMRWGFCANVRIQKREFIYKFKRSTYRYGGKIYEKLQMVKGFWKDQNGNDVGKADEDMFPQCLSSTFDIPIHYINNLQFYSECKPEYVKRLKGDLSDDVKHFGILIVSIILFSGWLHLGWSNQHGNSQMQRWNEYIDVS